MSDWEHNTLAADLASHFRGDHRKMVWEDMQLGPLGSARPDVFVMFKSYTNPKPMSYEVKISRSDFKSDVTEGKWLSYLDFSSAVYFCVPRGLVKKTEIPEQAGLMVRGEKGWRSTKRPTLRGDVYPDFWVMQKLLINGIDRLAQRHRQEAGVRIIANREISKKFGGDVATVVRDLNYARMRLLELKRQHKDVEQDIERIRNDARHDATNSLRREKEDVEKMRLLICEVLGLQKDISIRNLRDRLRTALNSASRKRLVASVSRPLERALMEAERASRTIQSTLDELNGD